MGISTGYCTVGNFGSEDRMDYTIIGAGVNLASRLESAAPAGGILISYETYAHVKGEVHCEQRGEVRLKGIADPVATYEAINLYADRAAARRSVQVDRPHLEIALDIDAMSAAERRDAADLLRQTLDLIDADDQPQADRPQADRPEAGQSARLVEATSD